MRRNQSTITREFVQLIIHIYEIPFEIVMIAHLYIDLFFCFNLDIFCYYMGYLLPDNRKLINWVFLLIQWTVDMTCLDVQKSKQGESLRNNNYRGRIIVSNGYDIWHFCNTLYTTKELNWEYTKIKFLRFSSWKIVGLVWQKYL